VSLYSRAGFEAFVLGLPAATLVRQWRDDSVAKIGGKIFALLDAEGGDVWFKCSDMSYTLLLDLEGVRPAPYFARAHWVAVSPDAPLTEDELRAYLSSAHSLVASRLTRRVKAELGLSDR
jgi:predicted DNA-binding protein (MmcQ/YjbR family)